LTPGSDVKFKAPAQPGWVRATLRLPDLDAERTQLCDPVVGTETSFCRNRVAVVALTSPIYLDR
jgi:hypothetical protein